MTADLPMTGTATPTGATAPRHPTVLLVLAYLGFISLGLPDAILGVSWPAMRGDFGQPAGRVGLVVLASTSAYLVSSLNLAAALARFGIGRLLTLAAGLMATALALIGLAPTFVLILGAALVLGTGQASIDAGLNAYAARHFSARHMNWLHASFGFGAAAGPLVVTATHGLGLGWRVGYGVVAVALAALAVAFGFTAGTWRRNGDGAAGAGRNGREVEAAGTGRDGPAVEDDSGAAGECERAALVAEVGPAPAPVGDGARPRTDIRADAHGLDEGGGSPSGYVRGHGEDDTAATTRFLREDPPVGALRAVDTQVEPAAARNPRAAGQAEAHQTDRAAALDRNAQVDQATPVTPPIGSPATTSANPSPGDSGTAAFIAPARVTLRLPALWFSAAAFVVYVGVELGAGIWGYTLLTEGRGVAETTAGLAVAAYWGGLFVGRLVAGAITDNLGVHRVLTGGVVGMSAAVVFIALPTGGWTAMIGLVLLGFSAAPVFPLFMLTTGERVSSEHADRTVGIQTGAAAIGAAVLVAGIGTLVERFGPDSIAPCLLALCLLLAAIYTLRLRPRALTDSPRP